MAYIIREANSQGERDGGTECPGQLQGWSLLVPGLPKRGILDIQICR